MHLRLGIAVPLFRSQRVEWIRPRGRARRQVARDESDADQHHANGAERCRIGDANPEYETLETSNRDKGRRNSDRNADSNDNETMSQEQPNDLRACRTKRHSNTDLSATLGHALRDHAINSDRGKKKRNSTENGEHDHRDAATTGRLTHHLLDRSIVEDGNRPIEVVNCRFDRGARHWPTRSRDSEHRRPRLLNRR